MKKRICIVVSILIVVVILAGCASPGIGGAQQETIFVSFGGSPTGLAGALSTAAIAGHVNRELSHINMTAEATGGSIENARMLNNGEIDFGILWSADGYVAWTGDGDQFNGEIMQNLRVLGNMYFNYLHVIALEESGIRTVEDLRGRSIAYGPMGSGSAFLSERIFRFLDMEDDIRIMHIGAADALTAMRDRQIDVALNAPTIPWGHMLDLASTRDVVFLDDLIDTLRREGFFVQYPFFLDMPIPAGVYDNITGGGPVPSIGVSTMWGTHKDVCEDLVYEIMQVTFDHVHVETLASTMAALASLGDEDAVIANIQIPLHPGAIRYWEGRGLELPETFPIPN